MRRTPLFQELLFTMVNSSNPHNYGKDLRYKYRFGVLQEVGQASKCRGCMGFCLQGTVIIRGPSVVWSPATLREMISPRVESLPAKSQDHRVFMRPQGLSQATPKVESGNEPRTETCCWSTLKNPFACFLRRQVILALARQTNTSPSIVLPSFQTPDPL